MRETNPAGTKVSAERGAGGDKGTQQKLLTAQERPMVEQAIPSAVHGYSTSPPAATDLVQQLMSPGRGTVHGHPPMGAAWGWSCSPWRGTHSGVGLEELPPVGTCVEHCGTEWQAL